MLQMNNYGKISIVVAEDEQLILENIVEKIEKADKDFNVVGYAQNGDDALNIIKEKMPDILFTDIRMPVMDGLELIHQAKKIHPNIHIVILSGYDDFSYAQQAIKLGVYGYLLKPLRAESLSETLSEIKSKIVEKISMYERNILIQDLNGENKNDVLPYTLNENCFYLYLICIGNSYRYTSDTIDKLFYSKVWNQLSWQSIASKCYDDNGKWWVVDEKFANEKFFICAHNDDKNEQNTVTAKNLQNALLEKLDNELPITIATHELPIAYSKIGDTAHELRELLEKGLIACSSLIITPSTFMPLNSKNSYISEVTKNTLKKLVKQQEIDMLYAELIKILDTWSQSNYPQFELQNASIYLLKFILEAINEYDSTMANSIEMEIYEAVATAKNPTELNNNILMVFEKHLNSHKKITNSSKELYASLEEFIRLNYLEPITVDTLAEKFNFSPHYIIRVFKKYKGEPPMQYLTSLRINEAKQLIKDKPDMDFKLISEIVGYPDPHYFSRIFKNVTNMSPSEYRDIVKVKKKI